MKTHYVKFKDKVKYHSVKSPLGMGSSRWFLSPCDT
jgi:hypothetical protein